MPAFPEHPLRQDLAEEVHARPYGLLRAPVRLTHLVVLSGEGTVREDRDHVSRLCAHFGVEGPGKDAAHFSGDLGPFRLKWERHTEFSAYTFYQDGPFEHPFETPVLDGAPEDWVRTLPGEVLAAINLAIETRDTPPRSFDELARLFSNNTVTGSGMRGGQALVWTDFRLHDDGYSRILIRDIDMNQRQAGRLVQRLLEVAGYRMMSMLSYPLARQALPQLSDMEDCLSTLITGMADTEKVEQERAILRQLSELSADVEALAARTAYRFDATNAYYRLVQRRIEELREVRLEDANEVRGLQPVGEFVNRRLAPAMETVASVAARRETLARRVARASDLLRTRVDVALEEQNRDLLKSMNRRARIQLRLQETVEGLSVVAISYYLTGLVYYVLKSIKALGAPIDPDLSAGIALPIVIALVWFGVKRLRKAISARDEGGQT
jgi:uncharacterized membrane-anchored protein